MSRNSRLGEAIIRGLEDAVAFERGELRNVRVSRVRLTARHADVRPTPRYTGPGIARLRARLRLSQPLFARALNVSPETVRAWEQKKRVPEGAALRLLEVAERHPHVILENLRRRSA